MKKSVKCTIGVLIICLVLCMGFWSYVVFFGGAHLFWMSYQQSPNEIYIMESGILKNALSFRQGEPGQFFYDFDNPEYPELRQAYDLAEIAQEGGEFAQAKNLMNWFSGRLTHKSDYDNHIPMNALALLEYSLDKPSQGINCRSKAQILNEMCLALGIYARKVWLLPNSIYDTDCHVVNEVWDAGFQKWIMLDITNNTYWVDEVGTPLSILEIRDKIANQAFCTPVEAEEPLTDLECSRSKHFDNLLYIAKNLVWLQYCKTYSTGESEEKYQLLPENLETNLEAAISQAAVLATPN